MASSSTEAVSVCKRIKTPRALTIYIGTLFPNSSQATLICLTFSFRSVPFKEKESVDKQRELQLFDCGPTSRF